MEHQQGISYQKDLFIEQMQKDIRQSSLGEDVIGAQEVSERQVERVNRQGRALTGELLGAVCSHGNMSRAFKQVKRNKGVAGIDKVPIGKFAEWYGREGQGLIRTILEGDYRPMPVRKVEIPKPNGGMRMLGIPTIQDRVIQQAIMQVLSPIFDQGFSKFSYGFRPRRNAQQALQKASEYVSEGRNIVVDMDMKSFFDEVNHDRLIQRLSVRIKDSQLLHLIRRYLQSGIMEGGVTTVRTKGTP